MSCNTIGANVVAALCNEPSIAGTGKKLYIFNYEDRDLANSVVDNDVISEIALKAGKDGYSFETVENGTSGSTTLEVGTYFSVTKQLVALRFMAKSEANKSYVNKLLGSKVIVVVPNLEEGTDGTVKYEVYGWKSGLTATELIADTEMADSVVYTVTMASGERGVEGTLPKTFYNTDPATTEAALDALLPAGS